MKKKAAMELSINAIVVIIIAVVMLALGLGFVRMIFGGATTKFASLIEQEADPQTPSTSNVMTISRSTLMTEPGAAEVIKIAAYNPTSADWTGGSCSGDALGCSGFAVANDDKCRQQVGCRWNSNIVTPACEDNPIVKPCAEFYDEVSCFNQLTAVAPTSCTWVAGTGGVRPIVECSNSAIVDNGNIEVNQKIIKQGDYATFDVLFSIEKDAPQSSSTLCYAKLLDYSIDFTIRVK
ncbi:MAG: hypothetical protein ABIC04_08065 [Nanoarchaeota archaeon]